MQVFIKDITEVEKELQVHVTAKELEPHFDKAYKREQSKIEVKGFRKGKTPLDLVKKLYGESIEYDSLATIANEIYLQVIEERNLKPIGTPTLTDMKYKRHEELSFTIKYEVTPSFELKEYKGIPVEKIVHQVTNEEIDEEILRLRKKYATFTEVQSVIDDEHVVTVDAQELDVDGTPLIGKKKLGIRVYLADKNVVDEVKDKLKGASVGETKRVKFEVGQFDNKLTNHLDLRITKIEKVQFPELSNEFVKQITKDKIASVAEYKEKLRSDLEKYWKSVSEQLVSNSIINEIIRRHDITVPESVIEALLDSEIEDIKNQYPNKNLPDDFNEQKYRSENRANAILQAKWYFIRDKILERENITIDENELERRAESDAQNTGIEKDRLLQFYKNSESIKNRLITEKLITFLKEHAVITEKIENIV